MSDQIKQEYHGTTIYYDENGEEWYVIDEHGDHQSNSEIKMIQKYIDRRNKSKFKRITVYVKERSHYYGSGGDKFVKATITSVGLDGTLFIVEEGHKHADQHQSAYINIPENVKKMKEIMAITAEIEKLNKKEEKLSESLKTMDGKALVKKIYGVEVEK